MSVGFVVGAEMGESKGNPWRNRDGEAMIAPSLLACDFPRMGEQVDAVVAAGADVLHVDVMDGHFVPNLSMGPPVVRKLRRYTDHPLDVHIMVTDPRYYIERFAEAGADTITFHVEAAANDGEDLIERLHGLGLGAGVTLRPRTPVETIESAVESVDIVLVMTVEPGYGGQEFMEDQLPKIEAVRGMLRPEQRLEVDGGINSRTAARCAVAGADVFVAGEDIFGASDVGAAVRRLRASVSGA